MTESSVRKNTERNRFELPVGDQLALAEYRLEGSSVAFTHTEVPQAAQGQGVAAQLVKFALDDARENGLTVIPQCPYVARYIERHPEYADLVASSQREGSR